jgi:N-acetyl-1-D-myo-inositol-2-amino-2-deoxy-alpha-D-glucopyranoside deacetylase
VEERRLLLVHAHPDDESITTGATMAKYAAEGVHVSLVTCTRGEQGEIIPAELAHLAPDREDALGEHRVGELERACLALGVSDHWFLGRGDGLRYRDSGMMGEPGNDDPRCFWRADTDRAVHELAQTIRSRRPTVIVTYDEFGGYGHPDHIQAHRVTLRAAEQAASPALPGGTPWQTRKVYAIALPASVLEASVQRLTENPGPFTVPAHPGEISPATPDDRVTTRIDAGEYWAAKSLALRAHATQISVDGDRFALTNGIAQEITGVEYFTLLRGPAPRPAHDGFETDLFA